MLPLIIYIYYFSVCDIFLHPKYVFTSVPSFLFVYIFFSLFKCVRVSHHFGSHQTWGCPVTATLILSCSLLLQLPPSGRGMCRWEDLGMPFFTMMLSPLFAVFLSPVHLDVHFTKMGTPQKSLSG